jgi:hypothetical protein
MDEFDIDIWIAEAGLSDKAKKKLLDAEIGDEVAVRYIDDETLLSVKLSAGDYVRFKRAQTVYNLKCMPGLADKNKTLEDARAAAALKGDGKGSTVSPTVSPPEDTGATKTGMDSGKAPMYTMEQFAAFLSGRPMEAMADLSNTQPRMEGTGNVVAGVDSKVHLPGYSVLPARPFASLPPPSHGDGYGRALPQSSQPVASALQSSGSAAVLDVNRSFMKDLLCMQDSTTNSVGEKPLLPCNFVSNVRGTVSESEEVIHTGDGTQLILKKTPKKPSPDKLSAGQWVSANIRILQRLLPSFSEQELSDYLDYTIGVGDNLQLFTSSSVFILDNEHRIDVHKSGRRWNNIDSRLENLFLKRKEEPLSVSKSQGSGGSKPQSSGSSSSSGRNSDRPRSGNVCWKYNSSEGCTFGEHCRYVHVDSETSSKKPSERAPRFQNKST